MLYASFLLICYSFFITIKDNKKMELLIMLILPIGTLVPFCCGMAFVLVISLLCKLGCTVSLIIIQL